MNERFTDRARKVLQLAHQEAQRLTHHSVCTEHVLIGLLKEDSGVAAAVLKNLNLTLVAVRRETEKVIRSSGHTGDKLPQTERVKKVIEHSIEEARGLGHNYIGTEHLLLGLLRVGEGVAVQILTTLGVTVDAIRADVKLLLGPPACVTKDQEAALMHLAEAWNLFVRNNHDADDLHDFRKCVHDAQRIIITEMYIALKGRPGNERLDTETKGDAARGSVDAVINPDAVVGVPVE